MDMHSIEAVVTDLEWQRLRRRVGRHPHQWLVSSSTWAAIRLLKLIARPAPSELLDRVARPD
jgi:hypothetical protein